MERRKVEIGGVLLTLPVARTVDEQAKGLMGRESLGHDDGMIFEYPEDVTIGYWMKNTYIPLDVAFVDSSGEIFQVSPLVPGDDQVVRPIKPYRWAVEMPSGWFDRRMTSTSCNLSAV